MPSVAYFITFTTYGTWLHGRAEGSVDRRTNQVGAPFLPGDPEVEAKLLRSMRNPPYRLDAARRACVVATIREVAKYRSWRLWAVHVRGNHVHIVVSSEAAVEKVMSDFKAYASRRLRERFNEPVELDRWTRHGSTRYLKDDDAVAAAVAYVVDEQGEPMAVYDHRVDSDDPADARAFIGEPKA